MKRAAFFLLSIALSAPAAGETLRCSSAKHRPVYLRIEAGRFLLREGAPLGWIDYCRPYLQDDHASCRTRRGHALAAVSGIDTGRELEFNPRRLTLIIRDWAYVNGLSRGFAKLRCAPAGPSEAPPA
jgi:hypothetical protein